MLFGDFSSFFSFGTRGFQCYIATHLGLMLPTIIFSKSNEVVAATICGTLLGVFTAVIIFAIIFIPDVSLNGFKEILELTAQIVGIITGVAVYYFGQR